MKIFKMFFERSENNTMLFQDISDIFHDSDQKEKIFLPLCSVNLKEIIPGRNEWIHFVDVWNNGDIDDFTFSEVRTRNSIKFKLENSKYHYLGDISAFPKFSKLEKWKIESYYEFNNNKYEYIEIPSPNEFKRSNRRLKELERKKIEFDYFLYVDRLISYLSTKERFKNSRTLITHKSFPKEYKYKNHEPIKQIGGTLQWEQRDMTPKDNNGKPLTFIGQVIGFHYMQNGSDSIYLFLNEKTNEAIQIFQYS
ncbi:hypothetical protein CEQ90_19800 [Lewinellaceae bacterium SD302]|nr:hypothetical protein CEQ90_19800 [Lewinellaceae bacterium SD302]